LREEWCCHATMRLLRTHALDFFLSLPPSTHVNSSGHPSFPPSFPPSIGLLRSKTCSHPRSLLSHQKSIPDRLFLQGKGEREGRREGGVAGRVDMGGHRGAREDGREGGREGGRGGRGGDVFFAVYLRVHKRAERWIGREGGKLEEGREDKVEVPRKCSSHFFSARPTSLTPSLLFPGVEISHGNLSHNLQIISEELETNTDTIEVCPAPPSLPPSLPPYLFSTHPRSLIPSLPPFPPLSLPHQVSWLPQYHDMGLIGSYLGLLYCGEEGVEEGGRKGEEGGGRGEYGSNMQGSDFLGPSCPPSLPPSLPPSGGSGYYTSPLSFIRRPLLWLELLSQYQATHTQVGRQGGREGGREEGREGRREGDPHYPPHPITGAQFCLRPRCQEIPDLAKPQGEPSLPPCLPPSLPPYPPSLASFLPSLPSLPSSPSYLARSAPYLTLVCPHILEA